MRAILTLILFLASLPLAAAEKPNVIFILADDLGYRELGCYGQEKIRTPRIDALAAAGMRFTRAYSGNAVCAPSRCVLMTGKHPGHATVRDNASVEPEGQHPLLAEDVTLAEVLKANGYTCGAFGKWGLGNVWSDGNPNQQGFDRFFGYNCQAHAHSFYPATLWSDGERFPLKNDPPVPGHAGLAPGADPNDPRSYDAFKGRDYAPDRIHEQALEFLRRNRDRPFFLYYPNILPHVALHVPDQDLEPYLALKWNDPPFTREKSGYTPHFTPRAAYAAMISKLDTHVGEVVDLVAELGLTGRTIIVFSSDNGTTHLEAEVDFTFFNSVGNLRGLKGELYEGGIRVPQIATWPGKIPAGSTSDRVTGFEDWLPTLAELTGSNGALPEGIDGISLAPTLLGETQAPRPFLYREFPGYGGQQALWLGQRWKGIRTNLRKKGMKPDPTLRLYDLAADPSESKDVAASNPEVVKEIGTILAREHEPSGAFPFPAIDG
ncbi:MAG: arylsulfatase [Verrucomicrobia bacterium]|nr:arylsulfatase [Verrucomicrobiota bacterium]